jgi:ABC-2 type transport system permease protein
VFSELLRREWGVRRAPVLVLAVVVGGMGVFVFGLTAGLSSSIAALSQGFPKALTAFIGGGGAGGYAVGELFTLIAPAALVGYAVVAGGATVAGEEEKGTMGILSAQPVTRRAILAAKAIALLLGVGGADAVLWAAVAISARAYDLPLDLTGLTAVCVQLLFLAIALGAVALAVGAVSGNSGLAGGVGAGIAVASYAANAMLPLARLGEWVKLTPWYYFAGNDPLSNGIDLGHVFVLSGIAVVALAVAFVGFARRDLKG